MEEDSYDVCIIGGGLWGSAAARYVSEHPNLRVCLIGPNEPEPQVRVISVDLYEEFFKA